MTRATERLQLIHSDVGGLYGAVMVDFKNHMKSQFKMSDLGLMSHFLGLEIQLKKDSKSIHRTKYAKDLLKRFQMQACKPVATPITFGCKLLKEDGVNAIVIFFLFFDSFSFLVFEVSPFNRFLALNILLRILKILLFEKTKYLKF
ncbi:hypothetical protein QUC31_016984 [Theobroma cacao]